MQAPDLKELQKTKKEQSKLVEFVIPAYELLAEH